MSDVQGIDLIKIHKYMVESFSLDELDVLVFKLGINSDNVPGATLDNKTIQIIEYCKRRGPLLFDLIALCEKERPYVQWRSEIESKSSSVATIEGRITHRREVYAKSKDIQMVHTIQPSQHKENYWDVFVYLIRHQSTDLSMVQRAEFFLGKYWGNKIFEAQNQDDFLGVVISAYGSALCTCRVIFVDGSEAMLNRYLDLEMSTFFSQPPKGTDVAEVVLEPMIINRSGLVNMIGSYFGGAELESVASNLGIDYEALEGDSKPAKVQALVTYMDRQKKLDVLLQYVQTQRPAAQWEEVYIQRER